MFTLALPDPSDDNDLMAWPKDEVLERVRSCTVRIVQDDGGGTGFLIAPRLVATCGHVLYDGQQPVPSRLQWRDHSIEIDFRAVLHSADDDVALIALPSPHDGFLAVDNDLQISDAVYAWGFSDDYPEGDSITLEYEGPTRTEHPLLKFKGGQVRPGMSGAPLVNQRTGAVCGMIVLSRDRRSSLGGRGIPATALNSLLPMGQPSDSHAASADYGWNQLVGRLALIRDELRTRRVSGSTRLTVANLLGPDGLLMPFRALPLVGIQHELSDPIRHITEDQTSKSTSLILAPPGVGKSTLAYALMTRLVQPFLDAAPHEQERHRPVPFLIDLRDYREEVTRPDFGSREWLLKRLDEVVGAPGLFHWSDISFNPEGIPASTFLILDSLDELLAGLSAAEVASISNSYMFRKASVVCCRTQFYERYLSASHFTNGEVAELQLPKDTSISDFIEGYYRICFPHSASNLAGIFQQRLESSPELTAVCRIPLRLSMALDLLSPGVDDLPLQSDLLGLYHAYVTGLLKAEAAKHGSVLTAEHKVRLLEHLAWHFYDEGNMGTSEASPFTDVEFDRFIAQSLPDRRSEQQAEVAEDLRNRSVLHVDGSMFSSIRPGTMSFVHKSFQEYLIARWLYDAMTTSPQDTAVALRHYMSPEVDEFVKEYIKRTRRTPRLLSEISQNCMAALLVNKEPQADQHEQARARMACEQLGYFLGTIHLPASVAFLESRLEQETDPWLRRGITCGLAVGGDERHLHAYVDKLRAERAGPQPHLENGVNLGFQLSFCGDQPFEPLGPDRDQGLPTCARTLQQLIYQLGTEVDRGSWRINLYTVIDLWKHRPVSSVSAKQTLLEHLPQLHRISDALREDERCNWWPEVEKLQEFLQEIGG